LKLHKVLKKNGLNPGNVDWFAHAIEIGAIQLPEVQGQYQSLQNTISGIQHRKQELEKDCQVIQRRIMELTETQDMFQQNFDTLTDKVNDLYNEKCQLEEFVSRFKNGNRTYLRIRTIAEQIVNRLLAEHGALLTSAIIAVVHALRENPDRCAIIFDNTKYHNTNNEYLEALREVASSFLKILSQMLDNTMVAAVKEK
jgi:chromosome segregation ATPase